MPDYRLYLLTPGGKIAGAPQEFFAVSDEAAITYAESQNSLHGGEVWERDRLVARVAAKESPETSSP